MHVLVRAVKRNLARFPEDFMFQLCKAEIEGGRSQIVMSHPSARMGLRRAPYAFTEQGLELNKSLLENRLQI